jgi:hypothetical protein
MIVTKDLDLKINLTEKFVAFIDVMGFSELVNSGNVNNLQAYFLKITQVLDKLRISKNKVESFLISDSIILIAPPGLDSLKQLLNAIRSIQSALLWRKILLRGAVAYGEVYYNAQKNIIVGKGFIRAYLLEKEAIYPRIIIDPAIIKLVSLDKIGFIRTINNTLEYNFEKRLIYIKSNFSLIKDDGIFIDYANKIIKQKSINGNLKEIYKTIVKNLYSDQKLYSKYVWLRDYFIECLQLTHSLTLLDKECVQTGHISYWIEKFKRL